MQNDIDDTNPFPDPVEIEITDIFDLHTIPPRDVKRVTEEYLARPTAKALRLSASFTAKVRACNARSFARFSAGHRLCTIGRTRHRTRGAWARLS